jgi:nicotinate phosphoribosyltransferase
MALGAMQGSEAQAFTAFHRYFPGAPLLIDTYDTIAAAQLLSERVRSGEMELAGVRLDSGDLVALSQQVRSLLPNVPIFASGDLDEWEIATLKAAGACIDGYGLGTRLVTGSPMNGVYKLVEIDGIPVMKESSGKLTYPGRKQIFRSFEGEKVKADRLGLVTESAVGEQALLQLVVKQGQQLQNMKSLAEIRERTLGSVVSLPDETRRLDNAMPLPVEISVALQELTQRTQERYEQERRRERRGR